LDAQKSTPNASDVHELNERRSDCTATLLPSLRVTDDEDTSIPRKMDDLRKEKGNDRNRYTKPWSTYAHSPLTKGNVQLKWGGRNCVLNL
jgi:hypothetical protein